MNLIIYPECVSLRSVSKLDVKGGVTILTPSLLHSVPPRSPPLSQPPRACKAPNAHIWVHIPTVSAPSFSSFTFPSQILTPGILFSAILNINTLLTNYTAYIFSSAYTPVTSFEYLSILKSFLV